MFGRYSLDKPGLILANQGDTLEDYLRQVSEPRFMPDADNVIPLLDGDWFSDDITGRFREFLRVAFGDEHYDENLRFIESALGKKEKPLPIRDFFLKDFYTDHVKRYKKRPIYWLFSSGSGTKAGSFNALIYLHRYRPDTASVVLQYLRDFRSKLVSERDHQEQMSISTSASQGEKTKALKRIEELKKILVELDDYERDTLYPLATRQVALDLDDGVKRNYVELGAALKKIPGLDAKDEE
jgi:type II restriction/modification system DNA methylase subunit YeeA